MYTDNKIYSSIMCRQLFKIINKHGVKCHFGSTPGVGYQDGTFIIKTLLNLRHKHNLPTWLEFADLFKVFDTSNHALLIAILGKYGAPPILFSAIKHMYNKRIVKLVICKVDTSINFRVGVKQGYRISPVIFLFLIMALVETVEYDCIALVISKSQFARKDNPPRLTRQLVSHLLSTLFSGTLFDIFFILF